ncbi:ER membrane protein complex subunit 1 protein [Raphanus sativus]|nr:ER membrane protein complex subunit 1 protein [Raphanus sativus]
MMNNMRSLKRPNRTFSLINDLLIHAGHLTPLKLRKKKESSLSPIHYPSFFSLCDCNALCHISQSYVTHALKVEGLRGIVTAPAKIESTTRVFAYGVDLFYTRLAPSKTYDSLTDDFSYALLLITIVALVAAIYIIWLLQRRRN